MSALTVDAIMATMRAFMAEMGPPVPRLRIQTSPYLTERRQVRFPRSKTRRIRKKWAKRPGNFATRPARCWTRPCGAARRRWAR